MKWFFVCILLTVSLVGQAQSVSTIGRTTGKYRNATQFNLYKYKSSLEQKLIKSIEVRDGEFFFTTTVSEYDLYMLENTIDNRFFTFVWDGHVEMQIDSLEFDKSKIINSPLTDQYKNFQLTRSDLFIAPIWRLDSLRKRWKVGSRYSATQVDSLQSAYNQLFDKNKEDFNRYTNKYITQNPTSLISLILLTLTGSDTAIQENKNLFKSLSSDLKKHTRAQIYLQN